MSNKQCNCVFHARVGALESYILYHINIVHAVKIPLEYFDTHMVTTTINNI